MKILVKAPHWLGDCVMSTIFLNQLKKKSPEAEISVLAKPNLKTLFENHPSVDHVLEKINGKTYDQAYILPRSFRSAWDIFRARVPKRIGYPGEARRFLLTDAIPFDDSLHYIRRYLKLIGEEKMDLQDQRPFFPNEDLPESKQRELFGDLIANLKKPFLGLGPASNAPARMWDTGRFREVAARFLQEKKGSVFLFGTKSETDITKKMMDSLEGPVFDLAGKLEVPELGGVLKYVNALVANESGLMHVASAFSIPTVVLSGPSDPSLTAPPYPQVHVIQHKEITCVPCVRNRCPRFGRFYNECLKVISVDEVMSYLLQII